MPVVDAFGESKAEKVMRDTWGHMDAEKSKVHPGTIVFAEGCFGGQLIILSSEFGDAGYGPWFYDGIQQWLCKQETEEGKLYTFKGTYTLTEDDRHIFDGEVTSVELSTAIEVK